MDPIVVKNATCTYCGCLCDDIELHATGDRIVRASRACALGRAWFFNHPRQHGLPAALIDGRPATLDAAVEAAAALLDAADLPLVYGLGNSTCESQRAAIMLAERIGGVIDSHTSLTHGPTKIAASTRRQADVHARRGQEPRRPHRLLGNQPGRKPSAPPHQVHAHAAGQVRAPGDGRIGRWCWWTSVKR